MANGISQELALEFRFLSDFLRIGGSSSTAQQRLVDLACSFVPDCEWAGITLRPADGRPRTLAHHGEPAIHLDELKYEIGDGPCLEAAHSSEPVVTADLTIETRWPQFCEIALEQSPVRDVMSFHLTDHPVPTALNLYTRTPGSFGGNAVTVGALFATHASTLMAHADSSHQAATLGTAITTSRQIGAAVGILMGIHKVTEPEAFDLLRHTSNNLNRKLRDIAQDVTDTGEPPGRENR